MSKKGKSENLADDIDVIAEEWSPSELTAWRLLLAVQVISALYNYISDCDEVYNYWEPMHFMQYRRGLQTWEYRSPPAFL